MSTGSGGRIPVAVLGATGAVGQTFIRLLDGHPFLEVSEVAASERSAGRLYREAMNWHEGKPPEHVMDLTVLPCDPGAVRSKVVFSALDSAVAGSVEQAFAGAGAVVLSNAKNHRMDADVPLVIPEVNADHLMLIDRQKEARGWEGAIITNSNCAVAPMTMALAPLHSAFGVRQAVMVTLQAISGAGYPGVPSLDILGNVIPHIPGEEEKIEPELNKMLGTLEAGQVVNAPIVVSAHCNRVPVQHGHTVCMTLGFESSAGPGEVLEAMNEWQGHSICRDLPSAPTRPLVVRTEVNRPQARKDADEGGGMAVVVGRLRSDPVMDVSFVAMAHNTVRGAAGGSILNAEVLGRMGRLPGVTEGAW